LGIEFGGETNKKKYKQKEIGLFHGYVGNFQIYLKSILILITLRILTQYDKTHVLQ